MCKTSVSTCTDVSSEHTSNLCHQLEVLSLKQSDDNILQNFRGGIVQGEMEQRVERCMMLFEHVGTCMDSSSCQEGEGCCRTKRILAHNWKCANKYKSECLICQQLKDLCNNHAKQCKSGPLECHMPYCPNSWHLSPDEFTLHHRELLIRLMSVIQSSTVDSKKQQVLDVLRNNPKFAVVLMKKVQRAKHLKATKKKLSHGTAT